MNQPPKKVAVLGFPISQSLSPKLHGFWLEKCKLEGSYEAREIPPEKFEQELRRLIEEEQFCGFNVTIPHKETALLAVDIVEPLAQRVGAVNTIAVLPGRDKRTKGDNTDVIGFIRSLHREVGTNVNFKDKTALVLGAGGAAKAIVVALEQLGLKKLWITNRSEERARALIDFSLFGNEGRAEKISWEEKESVLPKIDILVNTTSCGMAGKEPLLLDISTLPRHAVVCDIVYRPLETELLTQAKAKNLVCVSGLDMLIYQAIPGFEQWFLSGEKLELTPELYQETRDHLCSFL